MVVGTRHKILYGLLTVFLFTACALTGLFSGDDDTGGSAPTLIASSTPNLTVAAVFSEATNDFLATQGSGATIQPTSDTSTDTPVVTSTEAPTATAAAPDYAETPAAAVADGVEAFFIAGPPTIDGDLSDWSAEMYSVSTVVYGGEYYANEADLSGQFKIAWDDTYLYLGVVVFDTRFAQTANGAQLYLGDSLEILLDTNLAGDAEMTELSSDDFQIGISPGNLHDIAIAEAYRWYPSERMSSLPDVQIGAVLIEGGYVVEVAFPWAEVDVTPSDGRTLGFLFSISDNDMLNMNTQQSVVSFIDGRELQNPTTWSELLLTKP